MRILFNDPLCNGYCWIVFVCDGQYYLELSTIDLQKGRLKTLLKACLDASHGSEDTDRYRIIRCGPSELCFLGCLVIYIDTIKSA